MCLPENTKESYEASFSIAIGKLSISNELERLEEMKRGKICHQMDSQIIFIPYGHLDLLHGMWWKDKNLHYVKKHFEKEFVYVLINTLKLLQILGWYYVGQ